MPKQGEGDSLIQKEEEGAPPKQRALPAHGMHEREGRGQNRTPGKRHPLSSVCPQCMACRDGGERGVDVRCGTHLTSIG